MQFLQSNVELVRGLINERKVLEEGNNSRKKLGESYLY